MAIIKSSGWACLLIAVFTVSGFGCASSGTTKAIAPTELSTLAGTWVGSVTLPSGRAEHGTLEMSATGDYVARAGSFSAQGKAQVRDGNLVLVPTATTGGGGAVTGPRSSIAALSQRQDGSLVLNGYGHSAQGPFGFEVVRRK
jgi:hypothetical protein